MSMLIDIGAIKDEDQLRRMWQETDDFCRKKEIRAHMYKLRETRLRDFYSGDMDAGIGLSKTPLTASHGDSLADQSFQSFKTKEIRDSESPTREFKYGVPANLGGWNIMTSSELTNDGKMHTTHSLATTGGVHDLTDGQAKFTGRNEKISSVAFDGDNKNYTTSSGENSNTVLEENIVQGDENNRRVENKKSTVTTSSKVIRSHYESGDTDYEPRYAPSETIERKIIYNEAPQPRVTAQQPNNNVPSRNISPPSNNNSEQLISRTVEYPDPHTKVIREVKSLPDGSTITTTKYETRSANSEVWTSSNTNKNTSSSSSRITRDDRAEHNRIQYIIDDRGNQVPYHPNRHVQNKTTKDIEGYEIIIDTTNDRNIPTSKNVKKDLARDMERMTDQDDVIQTVTTTTTTTKTNRNNDVYDIKRPTKDDKKPIETEYTRKRISVDLDPTHEAFARSLRCVSPVSDRDSIRSHRSTTSSIRSSISPEKAFRSHRSNSRDTDISQISSQTVTKCGPTPGLKSPQRASPTKRPDITTTTVKTEKVIRIPKDEKPDKHTPKQASQVTDLDSDDTTTMVTTTVVENKDRPKTNRPTFVRSETYEERCRKILGMPEPDDQPKSPVTRRSKFSTTTTDFIENEKINIVKNRTIPTEHSKPKSLEKSPTRKPSGRPNVDEPTINTNTFDRKTARRPESSSPVSKSMTGRPTDEIIETTVNRSIQRRPNDNKSPSRVSPDRRSPSKIVETITSTITRKTPRGSANEGPDDHLPVHKRLNSESPDRKTSKTIETTKTTMTRGTPRQPSNDRESPDRKSPQRRPTTDRASPDRKTVTIKNVKNVEKCDIEINETIVGRKQPQHPVDGIPDRKSPNHKTTVTETTVTRKTTQPTKQPGGPDTDEELIDESEPEYETIDRKPTRRPIDEPVSDDVTRSSPDRRSPSRPTKNIEEVTETIIKRNSPRHPNDVPSTRKVPDRRSPDRPSKFSTNVNETNKETKIVDNKSSITRKTQRRPNDESPDRQPLSPTAPEIESDYDTTESSTIREIQRRPNGESPDRQSPDRKTTGQSIPNRKFPGRSSNVTEEITETIIQKSPHHPNDVPSNRNVSDRRSPDRPINTDVIETDEDTIESSVISKTQRRPNDDFPGHPFSVTEDIIETTITGKSPHRPNDVPDNRNLLDRKSPDRSLKFTPNVINTNKETIESTTTRQTHRRPTDQSPDRPHSIDNTETDEDTIESTKICKTQRYPHDESPDRQSPDRKTNGRPTPERKTPGRLSKVTGEITETTTTGKSPHQPNDVSSNRKVPDRRTPDRSTKITANVIKTNKETTEYSTSHQTHRRPNNESPDRQTPGRTEPGRPFTTEISETDEESIESTKIRKTQRHPKDESPDRQSPDRQSPDRKTTSRSTPERKTSGRPSNITEEITETTVTRKTSHQPNDVSSNRKVPDRRSLDRPTKITSNVIKTNKETTEYSTSRQTHRRPSNQSPDRQTPGRTEPGSPFTTEISETDDENIETTKIRKTQRHPKDESPDRQSPDRQSFDRQSPDRQSPDRQSLDRQSPDRKTTSRSIPECKTPGRPSNITEEITEKTVTRKTSHQPNDVSSNRKVPDRRSPDRPTKITSNVIKTNKETTEYSTSRQTHRRPNNQSPDRQTPDRTEPGRPFTTEISETDEETIESTKIRKTQRHPKDESPDRQSPDRKTTSRSIPERKTPGRPSNITEEITESTITRKSPNQPNDVSSNRKVPDRKSPDRPTKITSNVIKTNKETTEYSTSRQTHRRPNDQSPYRQSPDRKSPDRTASDRPFTTDISETDEETIESTATRKTQRHPNGELLDCQSPDRRSPDRKTAIRPTPERKTLGSNITEEITETTRKSPRQPNDVSSNRKVPERRSPDRPSKFTTNVIETNKETIESSSTRQIHRRSNNQSPDCQSPDRKTTSRPTPERKTPGRPSNDTDEVTETTITRETTRHPDDTPTIRESKIIGNITETDEEIVESTVTLRNRQSPGRTVPGRLSPDRKTPIQITDTNVSHKISRHSDDRTPDRRSPGRVAPDHRSSNQPFKVTEEITETSVTRNISDYRSPDRKTPIQSNRSPERLSKKSRNIIETDQKITEARHTRNTNCQSNAESPDDRPSRHTVPNQRSPGSKILKNVTETTTRKKSSTYPEDVSPDRKIPNRLSPDRSSKIIDDQEIVEKTVTRKIQRRPNDDSPDRYSPGRSPHRKSTTKLTETQVTRKIPRQSEQSPDRPYKTDTDEDRSPERQSPDRKTIDRRERPSKITNQLTETITTVKSQRYPTTRSPDRKNLNDKRPSSNSVNISPVRSIKISKSKNDEEFTETIVTRKIKRRPIDESPERKTSGRLTNNSTTNIPSKPGIRSPDRTRRLPTESPTHKTTTTVTKITSARRPTPSYTDDTANLRPKPSQKSPEDIVESDEPIDEPINKRRGDSNQEPGYLRSTQASRPKAQSPDRKTSIATYINETDEEIHETTIKRKPGYEHPDQSYCEPSNRNRVKKIPDIKPSDIKISTTVTTRRPVLDEKSPTRRPSQPDRTVDRSNERHVSEESEIDVDTVNQYERFIKNEIRDTETNRRPNSERPGSLRRKPDDVEVIFERVVDTTNLNEVDNALVEEEREVGCKLTEEPEKPKRRPLDLSPTRPYDSSPSRRTTLKKSTKFDDETEEITTTVERNIIRRPTATETSPDRRTTRPTKPRSPETSPVRRNIIKTVKEIIISPTQTCRVPKQTRSPETSPTRRTTHITTITKTIPDRSTSTTSSKSRPQLTPSQPAGQKKPNLDRINSEIITDRDEKRFTTTAIKSKQKTAPEIVPSIVQRYTTKTESPVTRSTKKKPLEFIPGPNEIVEEVFIKKDVKKLCDSDVCGPRPLTNGTPTTKRNIPKQEVRPKITEKIDRFSSNTITTQTNKKSSITERKNTAPITPSNRVPATDKFGRSASENQIRTPHTPKIEVNETVNKERRSSLKSKTARPTKCIATKTINITNTNLTVDNEEMDIVIDIQQAKSSREPSPNKMIPVPVSPETDTGPSRYPDNVTEPEDDRKQRRKITNIPIFEEETNTFVSCDITEVPADLVPHYDDLEEGNVDDSDDDVDHDRIVKVTDNDECLLSVSDKVSRFINLADETVTSKVTTKKTEIDREVIDRRRPVTKELENDDCLLSVSDKVSKFIMTAEEFKKPKASTDFVTIEKINETENRSRPEYERPGTTEDEEFDEKDVETINQTDRVNARKVTKVVERKPSETVITTTTTTTTRKSKPTEPQLVNEEITVTRPKETKVSTIASKFTKPDAQLTRQSSTKRITTDTKVSSIRTKFDKNIELDNGSDEPIDETEDRYEPGSQGREPFFLNQNGTNNQHIETISKIVQSSFVDQVPDEHQPSKGSVSDRFKPNTEVTKIKKITTTPILQSTEVLKKAKQIFEKKPNDRPKQIDILSRPSVWKYKTNDTKLTDIGVHTTKTTTTREEIESSEEESLVEPKPEAPKTPKLSARDEFTLKNLRDVTNISSKKDLFERKFSSDRLQTTTTINREFSESPIGGSPATTPTDSQGRYLTSNKPSYMNHTVSSLEHINRRDSRSQITSDHESIDDNNSINSNKFGVELRRVDSQNATKTRRKSSSTEIPCVEEIWDLELLERMLETVVGYEHRRRIRSQIRIIKKQIEEEEITRRITKERTRSPTNKRIETITTTTTVPKSQPTRKLSPLRTVTKTTRLLDDPDHNVSKVVTTTTTITKSGDITDDGKPIWMKKNLLKKPSENQIKTSSPSTTTSSSTTRKYNTSSYREVEKTDSVTSSYGIGPTDENGKPLFGIRALKKQAQKMEQPIESVYSTDSDPYQTRNLAETINLRAPQKIREGYQSATTTVKKSTKNFIQREIDDQPESDPDDVIEEFEEYESNNRAESKFTKKVHSNVQSFLGSEKTYTGFNDVIDRMKNADHVQVEGDSESDREARALLNKFLGASILVQATESALPDGVKVTQKTTRTLKSDPPVTSAIRQVTTTKLTKVKSSNGNNKDSSSNSNNNNNNTGAIATTITTTAINDIDSIWDESYLRKLLEQSSNYEERRKIRARIRQIMADKEASTDLVEQTTKDLSASSINTILTTSSSQSSEMDNTNDDNNNNNNDDDISNVTDGNNNDNNKKGVDDSKSEAKTDDIDGESLLLPLLKGLLSRKAQNTCTIKNNNNSNINSNSNDSKHNKNFIGPPVEDSGTESGEDLKLIVAGLRDSIDNNNNNNNNNSNNTTSNTNNCNVNNLLNDVTKALERLQNSLISDKDLKFDMNKKNTLLTLVSRLQSGLNQSGETSSALCDEPNDEPDDDENDIDLTIYNKRIGTNQNRFLKRRNRNNRHTIGVSRDEIAEARRLIEDIQLREKSLSNSNSNADSPDLTKKPTVLTSYSLQKNNSFGTFLPPAPHPVQPPQLFRPNQFVSQHSSSVHAKKLQFMKQSRSFEQEKFDNAADDEDSSTSPLQATDNKFIKNLQNNETKLSQVNGGTTTVYKTADDFKLNKYSNTSAKKLKMKRANTIDIPKNRLAAMQDADENDQDKDKYSLSPLGLKGPVKPSDIKQPPKNLPKFQPKTENDLKFLAFLNKQNSNDNKIIPSVARPPTSVINQQAPIHYRLPPQSAPILPTQPQRTPGQSNWTNQFGNRKNVFEFTTNQPATPNKPPIGYTGQQSTAKSFWKKSESFKVLSHDPSPNKSQTPAGPQYPWIGKEKERQNEQNQMVKSTPNLSQVNHFSHAPLSAFQPIAPRRAPQTIKPNIENVFKPITQNTQPPLTHQYKPVPLPRTMLNKQQTPSPVGEKFKPTHTLAFNSQPSSPARSPVIGTPWAGKATPERRVLSIAASKFEKTSESPPIPLQSQVRRNSPSMKFKDNFNRLVEKRPSLPNNSFNYATQFGQNTQTIQNTNMNENNFPTYTYTCTDYTQPSCVSTYIPKIERQSSLTSPDAEPLILSCNRPIISPNYSDHSDATEYSSVTSKIMRAPVQQTAVKVGSKITTRSQNYDLMSGLSKETTAKQNLSSVLRQKVRPGEPNPAKILNRNSIAVMNPPIVIETPSSPMTMSRSEPQPPFAVYNNVNRVSNMLAKSDSWHQINQMNQAYVPPKPVFAPETPGLLQRTKSGHTLQLPRPFEPTLQKSQVSEKQKTVEAYFSGKVSPKNLSRNSSQTNIHERGSVSPLPPGRATSKTTTTTSTKSTTIKRTKTNEKTSTGGKTTTEIVKETKKDDDGGITTTTTKVTTRTVTASKPVSPFAKFRQLDKQASTQSPPNSPHTPNTPKTPGQTSAPIFKFTDPALNRRVATFKEQLLQWCQIKTREYENVKIENFSTSWSDGLAFCALIHHFRPDAFDYTKLVATQRRFNFDLAFRVADEKAGIAPLLDVEDMVVMRKPDWKCVFTYVQSIYRRFKDAD